MPKFSYSTGYPFASVAHREMNPLSWLRERGDALHKQTAGEYDIVVWLARGKGNHEDNLTMCVFLPLPRLLPCHWYETAHGCSLFLSIQPRAGYLL